MESARIVGEISFNDLTVGQKVLEKHWTQNPDPNDVPLYVEIPEHGFYFVNDVAIPWRRFKSETLPAGILRGGGNCLVKCRDIYLAVYDTRYHIFKPFGGVANFCEGRDLQEAARRELMEDLSW
jgi:hypothetical protein